MHVEMTCNCEATLILETEESTESVWLLVFRFANAHVSCGYMTTGEAPESEAETTKKRLIKPRRTPEEPEE
jgi:hypothetical protein